MAVTIVYVPDESLVGEIFGGDGDASADMRPDLDPK